MSGMPSRARCMRRGRRLCAPRKRFGPETGHCENNGIVVIEKPDKMKTRSDTEPHSRVVARLPDRFRLRGKNCAAWSSVLATQLVSRCDGCPVVGQVPSLCGDAASVRLSEGFLHGWAGGTTGFLATPLRLHTATSRGNDDHHRGSLPRAGGEIYFCWSEFWTQQTRSAQNGWRSNGVQFDGTASRTLGHALSMAALRIIN